MGFFDDEDEDDNSPPECYADENEYDPESRYCGECPYRNSCGLKIRNANKKTTTRTTRSLKSNNRFVSSSTKVVKKSKDIPVTIDEDDEVSFTGALVHNASIEAMQAMVDELSNSIRHIPRKSYKNTWKRKKE